MSSQAHKILIRDEARSTERRCALTPKDAAQLIQKGFDIAVETSQKRIFTDHEYEEAGCRIVAQGTWLNPGQGVTILGLKELPTEPRKLTNPMVHFAHIYKSQKGWEGEMQRFLTGGGCLYDLEYLTDETGRRVAAFGYWAGWMGAAMALWRIAARKAGKQGPEAGVSSFSSKGDVEQAIQELLGAKGTGLTAVVIGAKGRSGQGACELLQKFGVSVSPWDIEETRNLDHQALLNHDILVNCVLMTGPGLCLLQRSDLDGKAARLKLISDVSCDPYSDFNPLPVYDAPTSWDEPYLKTGRNKDGEDIELTAIDNLPSLLPREASEDFSSQLLPTLMQYPDGIAWRNAADCFEQVAKQLKWLEKT